MVKPSAKKEIVVYLKDKYKAGINSCTSVVGFSRSSFYYKSIKDDQPIIDKLNDLKKLKSNRGFDNYYNRMKREGCTWSRNKVLRVYREQGLVRRPKKRRRLPEGLRRPLYEPTMLNEVWSMDFMSDALDDGRRFRVLNVIDDHNRECILNEGSMSYPSLRVIRCLEKKMEQVGYPKYIRTDNGPEFISEEYKSWCARKGIIPVYSEPGKPMQNGYIERFNRTFREDILDAYIFMNISQFNILADKWKEDYNKNHPHDSLGKMSPLEYKNRNQSQLGLAPAVIDGCII